ncbi:MAG TPA: N-acetylmuramoyl-L-alanine amidase [Streptosporangiaceae bacterium]|nr:N-acetylmuramoyl-L-alanine amidase [Streptosporangiaceae bacterium]
MSFPRQLAGVNYGPAPRGFGPALPLPPRWIIIHDTGNSASASDEVHYAASRTDPQADWTSAHFYVDTTGVIGSVPLDEHAWAAFDNANGHSWQIEMCGHDAGEPGAVPDATIHNTALLVARLITLARGSWPDALPVRFVSADGIAAGESGITGHLEFTQEEHRAGGHTDPGYRFDWNAFIDEVAAALGEPPTPQTPQTSWTETIVTNLPTLSQGATGPDVKRLQGLILAAGGYVGAEGIDGNFGPHTEDGLAKLQASHKIPNSVKADGTGDGIAGQGTWTWLLSWS